MFWQRCPVQCDSTIVCLPGSTAVGPQLQMQLRIKVIIDKTTLRATAWSTTVKLFSNKEINGVSRPASNSLTRFEHPVGKPFPPSCCNWCVDLREMRESFGLWILRRGFLISSYRILVSLSVEHGVRIPFLYGDPDSLECTPDSKDLDFELHKKNLSDSSFPIPQAKSPEFRDPDFLIESACR